MEKTIAQQDLLLRVSIKYAIILTIIALLLTIINTITYNPEPSPINLIVILAWIAVIVCLGLAHIEYNRKNEHFISFKDAILIGLIIIAVYFVVTAIFNFVNFELFLKEKTQSYYSEKYPDSNFSTGNIAIGFVFLSGLTNVFLNVIILFWLITAEAQWKIFKKAGRQGWESLIPIYNTIIFLQICQKPAWWFILLFIPIVNIIIAIMAYNGLSKAFGKTESFTVGLIFLPFVFFPLLGLSHLKYQNNLSLSESIT
jgi:hypothetical protein